MSSYYNYRTSLSSNPLNETKAEIPREENNGSRLLKIATLIFSVLSMAFLVGLNNNGSGSKTSMSNMFLIGSFNKVSNSDVELSVEVVSPGYDALSSITHLPWDAVAEPAKPQVIQISKLIVDGNEISLTSLASSDYDIQWTLDPDTKTFASGMTASFQLDSPGVRQASVSISSTNKLQPFNHQHSFKLAVKYIRREIRSLTEEDRHRFSSALQTMYTLSQEEGEKRFGENFQSVETLLYSHLMAAGMSDCDHWHDGAVLFFL